MMYIVHCTELRVLYEYVLGVQYTHEEVQVNFHTCTRSKFTCTVHAT